MAKLTEDSKAFSKKRSKPEKVHDFDGAWKMAIDAFSKEFVDLSYPELSMSLDWSKPVGDLNVELNTIHRVVFDKDEAQKIIADKLLKVQTFDGESKFLLIHMEAQSYDDKNFSKRMFGYFCKIYDKFCAKDDTELVAAVIYTYQGASGKTDKFVYKVGGVKILEYKYRVIDVETVDLPKNSGIALTLEIAKTYLKIDKTSEGQLHDAKIALYRKIIINKVQLSAESALCLIEFLECLFLVKDEYLNKEFRKFRVKTEGGKLMGVADIVKQMCIEKGREEGIEEGIEKGREEGIEIGEDKGVRNTIRALYNNGSSKEFIIKNLNLDMETLDEILNRED